MMQAIPQDVICALFTVLLEDGLITQDTHDSAIAMVHSMGQEQR